MNRTIRYGIMVVLAMVLATAAAVSAADMVNQGQGNRTVEEWVVNPSARVAGKTTQVLVLNTSTAVPTTALVRRKTMEIQNNGAGTIYCTVDGTAAVATTNGRWIAAGAAWSLDVGNGISVNCIAAASQTSGAATMVTELR